MRGYGTRRPKGLRQPIARRVAQGSDGIQWRGVLGLPIDDSRCSKEGLRRRRSPEPPVRGSVRKSKTDRTGQRDYVTVLKWRKTNGWSYRCLFSRTTAGAAGQASLCHGGFAAGRKPCNLAKRG